mmetsp:Transcript_17447/g.44455  ORF Transcript_17447/g.44455 Transcript_17447/m.44455 type:complete len:155 (+) Transcript_17447:67-531(+)
MFDFCTCSIALFTILTIVACILLMSLTGPYWYYIAMEPTVVQNVVIFGISGLIIFIMGIVGIFAALKKSKPILLWFFLVMVLMCVFTIAQLTLAMIAYSKCGSNSFFDFLCSSNEFVYFAHAFATIIITAICAVCSFLLRWRIVKQEQDPDNYY